MQGQGASQNDEIFIGDHPASGKLLVGAAGVTAPRGRNMTSAPKIDNDMTNFKRDKKVHNPNVVLLSPSSEGRNKQFFRSMNNENKINMLVSNND